MSCHGEHIATRGPLALYTDPHTPDVLTFCRRTAFFACYSPMMLLFYSRNNLLTVYMFVFNIRSCCFAFVSDRLDSYLEIALFLAENSRWIRIKLGYYCCEANSV